MRVALALLTLDPRLAGGSEIYVRGLCAALRRVGVHDYHALVPWVAADAAGGLPTSVAASFPAAGPAGRLRATVRAAALPGRLLNALAGADVVHYPVTVPVPRTPTPHVVTLHDLQHRDLPEGIDPARRLYRKLAYDATARRAEHVIVVSAWVRERAVELLGLDPARVHAIHHGVDARAFSGDDSVERERFLLYPARAWPHKNHTRLLEAFAALRSAEPGLRLVLTGGGHDRSRLPAGVELRGHVPQAELVSLYRRAAALVFPSLYEGFGLPVLEAMACGCPVAASSAGALPEVCGDAAVLFDPTDADAIGEGVLAALRRSDELSARGMAHVRSFTWEASAAAHDAVYALCA